MFYWNDYDSNMEYDSLNIKEEPMGLENPPKKEDTIIPKKEDTIIPKKEEIINWLVEIFCDRKLKNQTIFLGIVLFDKYVTKKVQATDSPIMIASVKNKLTALVCIYIAAKFEEIYAIFFEQIEEICTDSGLQCDRNMILTLEYDILVNLEFKVICETPYQYLKIFWDEKDLSIHEFHFSVYMCLNIMHFDDYKNFSYYDLVDRITDFTISLRTDKDLEKNINSDMFYSYLFLKWKEFSTSNNLRATGVYYSGVIKKGIIGKVLPNIICIHSLEKIDTNLLVKKNSIVGIPLPKFLKKKLPVKFKEPVINNLIKNLSAYEIFKIEQLNKRTTIRKLGEGTFGSVYHSMIDNKDMALKVTKNRGYDKDIGGIGSCMLRELNALIQMDHQNIVRIYGFYYDYNNEKLFIGLELMDTTLFEFIINTFPSEKTKFSLIKQLLRGVKYMHSQNIMHRDLSATNILISNGGILKISDFGSCRYYHFPTNISTFSKMVCSLNYRSIELLMGKKEYDNKIDVWSCACLIGFILLGRHLFEGTTDFELINNIFKILGTPMKKIIDNNGTTIPAYCEEVCSWPGFGIYPKWRRTGFIDLSKNYPEITDILYLMLEYNPDKRISIKTAKKLFKKIFKNLKE